MALPANFPSLGHGDATIRMTLRWDVGGQPPVFSSKLITSPRTSGDFQPDARPSFVRQRAPDQAVGAGGRGMPRSIAAPIDNTRASAPKGPIS